MFREAKKGTTSPCPILPPWVEVDQCKENRIKIGNVVELVESGLSQDGSSLRDGDFLVAVSILRNIQTTEIKLRGFRMKRCGQSAQFFGLLPRKLNEVCIMLPQVGGAHDFYRQSLEDIDVDGLQRSINGRAVKRDVIFTNEIYPAKSFRDPNSGGEFVTGPWTADVLRRVAQQSVLVCRWAWTTPQNISTNQDGIAYHQTLRRLRDGETDPDKSVPDIDLSMAWHNHESNPTEPLTYADGFCGCGGFAQGAKDAGLNVTWAFDANAQAIASFRMNHHTADTYTATVDSFLSLEGIAHVAILHISPPCQAFSQANTGAGLRNPSTIAGMYDDANSAASFCISALLRKVRPRIVTMEQTSSVLTHRSPFFCGIISQFVDAGYSVSWKILNFAAHGLPQPRKRLIIIASCPGGVLPPFPAASHGPAGSGLRRYTTINDCLRRVDRYSQYHNVPLNEPDIENYGDHQLNAIIATRGARTLHPRLGRPFTIAELLELMLFHSRTFRFGHGQNNRTMKLQIGNAVPPGVARMILRSIKRALKKEDVERSQARRERSTTVGRKAEGTTVGAMIDLTDD